MSGQYYSSNSPDIEGRTKPPPSPSSGMLEEDELVSELAYSRWKVEMSNKLIVDQEKSAMTERKAYKAREDSKLWKHKTDLHRKVGEEFGLSKVSVEAVHNVNLDRGREYKAQLEEYKMMVAHRKEEWAGYGHELTLKHGQDQAERTKNSLAESIDTKREMGMMVKVEMEHQAKIVATQRGHWLEEKRQHVAQEKERKIGKVDAAMRNMYEGKREQVDRVRRIEDRWRQLSKADRDNFLHHAAENHEKNNFTKEQMREARKELARSNHRDVQIERSRKEAHAQLIASKKAEHVEAKRAVRDGVYSTRFASPERSRAMARASRSKSPEKAARDYGLVAAPPKSPPSPYKIS